MEIEVKLQYQNKKKLIQELKKNKFKLKETKKISDLYYGQGHSSMSSVNKLYRLRNVNDKLLELTLKDKTKNNNNVLTRREINVTIDSIKKMDIILQSLNCNIIKKNVAIKEIWVNGKTYFEFINITLPQKLNYAEIEAPSKMQIAFWLKKLAVFIQPVDESIFAKFDQKRN